jgi:hypothetical protein
MNAEPSSALDSADHEYDDDGGQTFTFDHPAGPITLELRPDTDCTSPLDPDWGDFLPALAMIARGYEHRPRYVGTTDVVPADMSIDCPRCDGYGAVDRDSDDDCPQCDGTGEIETDDVETYLRARRGAVATREIAVGGRDQAPAVIYFTADDVERAGIPDPTAALESHASEYRRWEDGDCWGYVCSGPGSELDSVWGFIGEEYALEEARGAFDYAVERADVEHRERAYWAARDVETVDTGAI